MLDELLANNQSYIRSTRHEVHIPVRPALRLTVLTCMDSRIDIFAFLGLQLGDAHVIRNAGALATDDMLRSLLVSQRLLETRAVMVIGHTDCGLHGLEERSFLAKTEREVGLPVPFTSGAFVDLDDTVRTSVRRIRECAFLPHRDEVWGCVFDVDTGRLRDVT